MDHVIEPSRPIFQDLLDRSDTIFAELRALGNAPEPDKRRMETLASEALAIADAMEQLSRAKNPAPAIGANFAEI